MRSRPPPAAAVDTSEPVASTARREAATAPETRVSSFDLPVHDSLRMVTQRNRINAIRNSPRLLAQRRRLDAIAGPADQGTVQRSVRIGTTTLRPDNLATQSSKAPTKTAGADLLRALSAEGRALVTGADKPPSSAKFSEVDAALASKVAKFNSPSTAWANWKSVRDLPDPGVFGDPHFLKLAADGSTYQFDTPERLAEELAQWGDGDAIPPRFAPFIREFASEDTAENWMSTDPNAATRRARTAERLQNCGNTRATIAGRINDASGRRVTLVYDKYFKGAEQQAFFDEVTRDEGVTTLLRIVIDSNIHEFTLEKRGTQVVLHQGYQGHFNALWWAGADGDNDKDNDYLFTGRKTDDDLAAKRDTFGRGNVLAASSVARPMADFLARTTYGAADVKARWAACPFPARDATVAGYINNEPSKEIYFQVQKFKVSEAAETPAKEALGGDGTWLSTRVMKEATDYWNERLKGQ